MSFREYVSNRRRGPNPQGDFVEYARRAEGLTEVSSWEDLRRHLLMRDACPGAIDSARSVWKSYRARQRRERQRH